MAPTATRSAPADYWRRSPRILASRTRANITKHSDSRRKAAHRSSSIFARRSDASLSLGVYESAPMTLVEALGVGLPVIASRIGNMTRGVRHDETGRLFEAG